MTTTQDLNERRRGCIIYSPVPMYRVFNCSADIDAPPGVLILGVDVSWVLSVVCRCWRSDVFISSVLLGSTVCSTVYYYRARTVESSPQGGGGESICDPHSYVELNPASITVLPSITFPAHMLNLQRTEYKRREYSHEARNLSKTYYKHRCLGLVNSKEITKSPQTLT